MNLVVVLVLQYSEEYNGTLVRSKVHVPGTCTKKGIACRRVGLVISFKYFDSTGVL